MKIDKDLGPVGAEIQDDPVVEQLQRLDRIDALDVHWVSVYALGVWLVAMIGSVPGAYGYHGEVVMSAVGLRAAGLVARFPTDQEQLVEELARIIKIQVGLKIVVARMRVVVGRRPGDGPAGVGRRCDGGGRPRAGTFVSTAP